MKSSFIVVLVSFSLLLHTALAISGLRYFQSSLDNVNRYRIRDTVPSTENAKNQDDVNVPSPTDSDNVNLAQKVQSTIKRPIEAAQGLLRPPPAKLRRENSMPEELPPSANVPPYTNDGPSSVGTPPPKQIPMNEEQAPRPVVVNPPFRRRPYPDQRTDTPAPSYSPKPLMAEEQDEEEQQVSPIALGRLRQFASVTSILANIARVPQTVALQIDSVIAGLQNTYPTSTNVGAYLMGTRFLLRNQVALKPFDLMDRAGLGRIDQLVSSIPSMFNPVLRSVERYMTEVLRRITAALQRIAEYARRVGERARNSFSGMNFARNSDSYAISVPNAIDMVLKGRLAAALDGIISFLQNGLVSRISRAGNYFSGNTPVSNPVQNVPYQLRTAPRYSESLEDYYYTPIRYYSK